MKSAFRWLLYALGGLAGVAGLLYVAGLFVPAGHVARRSAYLAKPPEDVWGTITDFAAVPTWWGGVKKAEKIGERNGQEVWRETFGFGDEVELITTEFDPPRKLVRTIPPQGLPFHGSWTWEIEPAAGGCRLTVTERGEVSNPFLRTLTYLIFDQRATIDSFLEALGKKLGVEIRLPG